MYPTHPEEHIDGEARYVTTRSLDAESGTLRVHQRVSPLGNTRLALERLTHEFAVLKYLEGIRGVPEAIRLDLVEHELVMRAVGGRLLEQCHWSGQLQWPDLVLVALGILRILTSIHAKGVVHLDLSPTRIRVVTNRETDPPRFDTTIIGFSHAVFPGIHGDFTKEGALASQPAYNAPEQTGRMNRGIDHRADLYSLGVVLYELACGRLPFDDTEPLSLMHAHLTCVPALAHTVRPDVPPVLSQILARMLLKVPEQRPASANELIADFEALQRHLRPAEAGRPSQVLAAPPSDSAAPPAGMFSDPVEVAVALLKTFDSAERLDSVDGAMIAVETIAVRESDEAALEVSRVFAKFLHAVKTGPVAEARLPADRTTPERATAVAIENLFRCLAAVFHRDWHSLAAFAAAPLDDDLGDDSYLHGTARFAHCMALLGRIEIGPSTAAFDAMAHAESRLGEFAAIHQKPFRTLHALVQGLHEEAHGEHWNASRCMDKAMASIRDNTRSWHRALVLEHNGRFYMKHDLTVVARRVLERAASVYQRWGADRRLEIMAEDFPFLSLMQPTVSDPDAPVWTSAADRQAILQASQALSSETDLGRLVIRMTDVIEKLAGATAVAIFFNHEIDGWLLAGARRNGQSLVDTPLPAHRAQRHGFAGSVVRHAMGRNSAELIGNAVFDARFAGDPQLKGSDCCSILLMPIASKGSTRAMLVLENRVVAGFFTGKDLDTLNLIAGTLSTSIENALLYRSLEQRVTNRTRELELMTSTLALRERALENTINGVLICELAGRSAPIIYVNPMFEKITGFTSADVIGTDARFLHRGDSDQPEVAVMAKAIAERTSCKVVLRNYRSDGSMFYSELAIAPVANAEGRVTHYVGVQVDVTDRLQREAVDRRKTARLSAVFELSPDGIVVVDQSDRISIVNPAFERMTGLSAGALMGQSLGMLEALLKELSSQDEDSPWRDSDFGDSDRGRLHADAPRPGGDRAAHIHLRLPQPRTLLRRDIGGETPGGETVLSFRDITRELELDQMKRNILSAAAHELRTPMQSIFGFTELVLERDLGEEQRRSMLKTIHAQVSSLITMINDLLDLARLEARRGVDSRQELQLLQPIVKRTVDALMIRGDNRRVRLHSTRIPRWVNVDGTKLSNALTNLLSNAFKYSDKGDIVVGFLTRENRGRAEIGIRVTDQGRGMTASELERLFERFYRVDSEGRVPGTGLGTTLAKELVEMNDGELIAQSQYGIGTSMTIWLPLREAPANGVGPRRKG